MNRESVIEVIAVGLIDSQLRGIEQKFANIANLKNEIKYHQESLNKALAEDFSQFVEILQAFIDKFYWNYYEVESFLPFRLEDFDVVYAHNQNILKVFRKLVNLASR